MSQKYIFLLDTILKYLNNFFCSKLKEKWLSLSLKPHCVHTFNIFFFLLEALCFLSDKLSTQIFDEHLLGILACLCSLSSKPACVCMCTRLPVCKRDMSLVCGSLPWARLRLFLPSTRSYVGPVTSSVTATIHHIQASCNFILYPLAMRKHRMEQVTWRIYGCWVLD